MTIFLTVEVFIRNENANILKDAPVAKYLQKKKQQL